MSQRMVLLITLDYESHEILQKSLVLPHESLRFVPVGSFWSSSINEPITSNECSKSFGNVVDVVGKSCNPFFWKVSLPLFDKFMIGMIGIPTMPTMIVNINKSWKNALFSVFFVDSFSLYGRIATIRCSDTST